MPGNRASPHWGRSAGFSILVFEDVKPGKFRVVYEGTTRGLRGSDSKKRPAADCPAVAEPGGPRAEASSTANDDRMSAKTCPGLRLADLPNRRSVKKLSCASPPKFRATPMLLAAVGDGLVRLGVAGNLFAGRLIDSGIGRGLLGKQCHVPKRRPPLDFTIQGNMPSDVKQTRENTHRSSDEVSVPFDGRKFIEKGGKQTESEVCGRANSSVGRIGGALRGWAAAYEATVLFSRPVRLISRS